MSLFLIQRTYFPHLTHFCRQAPYNMCGGKESLQGAHVQATCFSRKRLQNTAADIDLTGHTIFICPFDALRHPKIKWLQALCLSSTKFPFHQEGLTHISTAGLFPLSQLQETSTGTGGVLKWETPQLSQGEQ